MVIPREENLMRKYFVLSSLMLLLIVVAVSASYCNLFIFGYKVYKNWNNVGYAEVVITKEGNAVSGVYGNFFWGGISKRRTVWYSPNDDVISLEVYDGKNRWKATPLLNNKVVKQPLKKKTSWKIISTLLREISFFVSVKRLKESIYYSLHLKKGGFLEFCFELENDELTQVVYKNSKGEIMRFTFENLQKNIPDMQIFEFEVSPSHKILTK